MYITMHRKTGWQGSVGRMSIYLDGEKADSIRERETRAVSLNKEQQRVSVRQSGLKSGELEVKHGDEVRITMNPWHRFIPIIYFAVWTFVYYAADQQNRFIILTAFSIPLIISLFLVKGYRLEVMDAASDGTATT